MTSPAEVLPLLQRRLPLRKWGLTTLNALTTGGCSVAHRFLHTHRKRAATRLLLPWRITMFSVLSTAFAANAGAVDTIAHREDPTSTIAFHPFTFLPPTGDIVDPINLIFIHNGNRQAVHQALVARGWYRFLASEQWMHFPEPRLWKPQDADYFYGSFRRRYHIRLFDSEVYTPTWGHWTVATVHHESWRHGDHVIDCHWDDAKWFVALQLCRTLHGHTQVAGRHLEGSYTGWLAAALVTQKRLQGGTTEWRGWRNSAQPIVIEIP